jgi:selenocysteine-specific translation elongation factor
LLVMPVGELCTVKSIQAHDESAKWAQAGDNVEVWAAKKRTRNKKKEMNTWLTTKTRS